MIRDKRHRWHILIGLAAAALILGAPSIGAAQGRVRIALSVPNYGPYAPVYVADELGYYKRHGVTAEITAYRGGGAAQEAVVAGAAEILNYFPPGVAIAVKKGIREKIVAAGQVRGTGWHIMVLRDAPIRSLRDLGGKKVGITVKGTTTDFYALWAGAKGGVAIQTIPVGGAGLVPALKSRQIDAAVLFSPLTYRLLLTGEGRSLADLEKEMEPTLPDVWVATQKLIDEQTQLVAGTLKAIYTATVHMQRNREYSLKYLKGFTKEADDRVVQMEYEIGIMGRSADGMIRREWMEASLALAKLGGITDLPRIEELFTDRFIPVKVE